LDTAFYKSVTPDSALNFYSHSGYLYGQLVYRDDLF
jgi:hypothetical protein